MADTAKHEPAVPRPRGIRAHAIGIAWPASIEYIVMTGIMLADTIFISRVGTEEVAGVSIAFTLIFMFVALFNAVAIASTTVVAQAKGAGNMKVGEEGAAQSVLLAVLIGLVTGVVGSAAAGLTMKAMGLDGVSAEAGATYMGTVLLSAPLYAVALTGGGIMKGVGDTRTPMVFTVIANSTKIGLSALLVFGLLGLPALGVKGAALATVVGYSLNALMVSTKLLRGFDGMRLSRIALFRPRPDLLRRLFALSMPVAGEQIIMRMGFVFYMRVVSSLGTIALAANVMAMRLESVALTVGFGFTVASTTLVGQAVGRRDYEAAEKKANITAQLSVATMATMAVILLLVRTSVLDIFNPEAEVRGLALACLVIAAFELVPLGFIFTYAGALRGAGDTRSPMIVALVGTFLFRLPLVYALAIPFGLGLKGIWYGTLIDWIGRAVVIYVIFRRGKWKTKAFIQESERDGSGPELPKEGEQS
jgi:putative MATE family efflux protein